VNPEIGPGRSGRRPRVGHLAAAGSFPKPTAYPDQGRKCTVGFGNAFAARPPRQGLPPIFQQPARTTNAKLPQTFHAFCGIRLVVRERNALNLRWSKLLSALQQKSSPFVNWIPIIPSGFWLASDPGELRNVATRTEKELREQVECDYLLSLRSFDDPTFF
jgi:hypothetical protein